MVIIKEQATGGKGEFCVGWASFLLLAGEDGKSLQDFCSLGRQRPPTLGLNRDRDGVWLTHVVAVFDDDEA